MWLQHCRKRQAVLWEHAVQGEFPELQTCLSVRFVKFYETSCNAIHLKLRMFRIFFLPTKGEAFALQFLARMEVDNAWPWNILRTDEAHFHLQSSVNTQNCRIWTRENPFQMQPLPLNSQKVTVWWGFTAAFIVGPFVLEEIGPSDTVPCTVNGTRYESLWRNQLIPALQQRECVDSTIFMQDGAPPNIATPVKQLLNLHFGNDRIISCHFPTALPPRSPDLNPCDFWLWGYLKDVVYGGPIANFAELKYNITQHIHKNTPICCETCCFELSAHRRNRWTAY
ncbi:hypothetical protein AVEN_68835-1 [Araneus ventricosus]|uniref:Tc1-like transposase DDE domain-containing protein n=1 Tax=Araneus ventricosus TaxID=182803 RepID=A0A4Y2C535_ARAVE|nr:hypothetical protein AVEN_68835-1 [Araneus ventricosus]